MLFISMVFSALLLAVTCGNVRLRGSTSSSQVAWLFLIPGVGCAFTGMLLPVYVLNVVLVGLAGIVAGLGQMHMRWYYVSCLVVTVASYGVGAIFAVEHVREEANLYPYESLEERLSYEQHSHELPQRLGLISPGETGAFFDEDRLAEVEDALKRDEFHPRSGYGSDRRTEALEVIHEHHVRQFINSPSFGVGRMSGQGWRARPSPQDTLPMSLLDQHYSPTRNGNHVQQPDEQNPESALGWLLHRDCVADFLSPSRFGYVKDRSHVTGFQWHQFNHTHDFPQDEAMPQQYRLRRLELVSLLKHEQPGAYVTENLPRMDELSDVPIRPLDDFERDNLRGLWHGDDLAVIEMAQTVRVLGAIRAGKQCLSCHEAKRGDLLGAFSYHLDALR
jgi:hypothetical protein